MRRAIAIGDHHEATDPGRSAPRLGCRAERVARGHGCPGAENFPRTMSRIRSLLRLRVHPVVAEFGSTDVERLLSASSIVRHRGKIEAAIANARATLEAQDRHGSLGALAWSFASKIPTGTSAPG